jgi:hypothetical protein
MSQLPAPPVKSDIHCSFASRQDIFSDPTSQSFSVSSKSSQE